MRNNFETRGRDYGGEIPAMRVPDRAPVPSLSVLIRDVITRSQSEFYGVGKTLPEVPKVVSPGSTSAEGDSHLDATRQIDLSK